MKLVIFLLNFLFWNLSIITAKIDSDAVKVSYKLSHSQIKPGDTLLIEFNFKIKKGWHIYWINPGDAGLPTIITPLETSFGKQLDVLMPAPKALSEDDLTFYCYENQTKMIARFLVDTQVNLEPKVLNYELSWLVCKNECFPGSISFNIPVNISNNSNIINRFKLENYPTYLELRNYEVYKDDDKIIITLDNINGEVIKFYPISPGFFVYNQIEIKNEKNNSKIILPLDKFREKDPETIEGLFVLRDKKSKKSTKIFYSKIY